MKEIETNQRICLYIHFLDQMLIVYAIDTVVHNDNHLYRTFASFHMHIFPSERTVRMDIR